MLEHEELGTVGYEWPRFWPAYLKASRIARDELEAVHAALKRAEPDRDDSRVLTYDELEPAIVAHAHMVIASVLTLRYFVLEVERTAELQPPTEAIDDLERFRSVCVKAGLADPSDRRGWSTVGELIGTRHRVEHPTQDTVYSLKSWDHVPLAWALTKRALDSFDAFDEMFGAVADAWEGRKEDFAKPGTLNIEERGLRGKTSAKKPPPG
jgi:hypothetical protein